MDPSLRLRILAARSPENGETWRHPALAKKVLP